MYLKLKLEKNALIIECNFISLHSTVPLQHGRRSATPHSVHGQGHLLKQNCAVNSAYQGFKFCYFLSCVTGYLVIVIPLLFTSISVSVSVIKFKINDHFIMKHQCSSLF